jgi:hypothetical protein
LSRRTQKADSSRSRRKTRLRTARNDNFQFSSDGQKSKFCIVTSYGGLSPCNLTM